MSGAGGADSRVLMTQVIGLSRGGNGGGHMLGEIESAGVSIRWNRATLSPAACGALRAILERNGGVMGRSFELRHGSLVLLRCRMLPGGPLSQITFDSSQRRRCG